MQLRLILLLLRLLEPLLRLLYSHLGFLHLHNQECPWYAFHTYWVLACHREQGGTPFAALEVVHRGHIAQKPVTVIDL